MKFRNKKQKRWHKLNNVMDKFNLMSGVSRLGGRYKTLPPRDRRKVQNERHT